MTDQSPAGRPPATTDQQIIDIIETAPDPVLTTKEIAEELPIGERSLRTRLTQLAEENEIVTKKVGRSRVWYAVELLSFRDHQNRRDEIQEEPAAFSPASELRDTAQSTDETRRDSESAESALELYKDLDPSGGPKVKSDRRLLVRDVLEYIRDHGGAGRRELLDEIVNDNPAGFQDGHSAWKNLVQPSLGQLAEQSSDLVSPGEGGHTWTWRSAR